jgi:hypothetical protein
MNEWILGTAFEGYHGGLCIGIKRSLDDSPSLSIKGTSVAADDLRVSTVAEPCPWALMVAGLAFHTPLRRAVTSQQAQANPERSTKPTGVSTCLTSALCATRVRSEAAAFATRPAP